MKTVVEVRRGPDPHWVGDGFEVRPVIRPQGGEALGPFILMDYAGPTEFLPSAKPRGVETHPHKGFETVTIVFQGEVEHRDSRGNSGKIGPGDVQWMTAASGILHEEMHSRAFTQAGGVLEMAQIWVNLPAKDKAASPNYQTLVADQIPSVPLAEGIGQVRLVAGDYQGTPGAASTFTPMVMWVVRIDSAGEATLPIPEGQPGGIYVRQGQISVGGRAVGESDFVQFSADGEGIVVSAEQPAEFLVLAGERIDEPMVTYGPFVMNSQAEIVEAIEEFRAGKYGSIA